MIEWFAAVLYHTIRPSKCNRVEMHGDNNRTVYACLSCGRSSEEYK